MGKLINRIPGSRLLISSLPGSALRTPCLVNLISKDTHLVFSISNTDRACHMLLCCRNNCVNILTLFKRNAKGLYQEGKKH